MCCGCFRVFHLAVGDTRSPGSAAATIVSGGVAERVNFGGYCIYSFAMTARALNLGLGGRVARGIQQEPNKNHIQIPSHNVSLAAPHTFFQSGAEVSTTTRALYSGFYDKIDEAFRCSFQTKSCEILHKVEASIEQPSSQRHQAQLFNPFQSTVSRFLHIDWTSYYSRITHSTGVGGEERPASLLNEA